MTEYEMLTLDLVGLMEHTMRSSKSTAQWQQTKVVVLSAPSQPKCSALAYLQPRLSALLRCTMDLVLFKNFDFLDSKSITLKSNILFQKTISEGLNPWRYLRMKHINIVLKDSKGDTSHESFFSLHMIVILNKILQKSQCIRNSDLFQIMIQTPILYQPVIC